MNATAETPTPAQELMPASPREQQLLQSSQPLNVFLDGHNFVTAQRMATALCHSSMVPTVYRRYDDKGKENPDAMGNCIVALDYATRLKLSPLMVMQNLYTVHGRPSLAGTMVAALINASGLFKSRLRYDVVGTPGKAGFSVTAWTIDHDGIRVDGTPITWEMVVGEGWTKNSKWTTMPLQMAHYRAATFFGRVHASDVLVGLRTVEEIEDMYGEDETPTTVRRLETSASLDQRLSEPEGTKEGKTDADPAGTLPPRRRRRAAAMPDPEPQAEPGANSPVAEPETPRTDAPASDAAPDFSME